MGVNLQYLKKEIENIIYQVSLQHFLRYGYESTTMREIAREVGITAPNIYRYFKNKEHLFEKIVDTAFTRITELFSMNTDSTLSAVEVGEILLSRLPTLVQNYRVEMILLVDGSKGTRYANAKKEIIEILTNDVRRHIILYNHDVGQMAINTGLARPLAVSFLEGIMEVIRTTDDNKTITELIAQLIQIYFFWSATSNKQLENS